MSELKTNTDIKPKFDTKAVSPAVKPNGRKLFNYYIQKNIADMNQEKVFWYRTNRWRFSSKGYSTGNNRPDSSI